jgi:nucleoside-triphosphatase
MNSEPPADPHVLLLTGTPGIGKTTVIRRAADRLKDNGLRGFYTEEVREKGERRGFRLVSFQGTAHIIAHVKFPKSHRVGKYGVAIETLDDAAALLRPDTKARLYLVDEIGKMECLSERFIAAMRVLISSVIPIVATVGARGGDFIAEVKRMPACELWHVTHANRDNLPSLILTSLREFSQLLKVAKLATWQAAGAAHRSAAQQIAGSSGVPNPFVYGKG